MENLSQITLKILLPHNQGQLHFIIYPCLSENNNEIKNIEIKKQNHLPDFINSSNNLYKKLPWLFPASNTDFTYNYQTFLDFLWLFLKVTHFLDFQSFPD